MHERWSRERVWQWYDNQPWLRGCNFMSSDCANRIDQWQEEGFEERLQTADAELALAEKTGFNTIRIILEYYVWEHQHDGFMQRLERYIATAWKHGISCMIVFGNDCMQPKEWTKPIQFGHQHYDWGYHGGRKQSQHGVLPGMGYSLIDEPNLALRHYEWVREIIETYKEDNRIIMWDLYNEAGNSGRGKKQRCHGRFRVLLLLPAHIPAFHKPYALHMQSTFGAHPYEKRRNLDRWWTQ